jgi:hypothetical protein
LQTFLCDFSFWLTNLNFGMCIKDPINKTCWKMVKIRQTGFLKLKFEIIPKKCIFLFLPKIFTSCGWSLIFLPIFKSLGPLGVRDRLLYLKMWKSQNHCTLVYIQQKMRPFQHRVKFIRRHILLQLANVCYYCIHNFRN